MSKRIYLIELLAEADMLIWDEMPITDWCVFDAIDKTLYNICGID